MRGEVGPHFVQIVERDGKVLFLHLIPQNKFYGDVPPLESGDRERLRHLVALGGPVTVRMICIVGQAVLPCWNEVIVP